MERGLSDVRPAVAAAALGQVQSIMSPVLPSAPAALVQPDLWTGAAGGLTRPGPGDPALARLLYSLVYMRRLALATRLALLGPRPLASLAPLVAALAIPPLLKAGPDHLPPLGPGE